MSYCVLGSNSCTQITDTFHCHYLFLHQILVHTGRLALVALPRSLPLARAVGSGLLPQPQVSRTHQTAPRRWGKWGAGAWQWSLSGMWRPAWGLWGAGAWKWSLSGMWHPAWGLCGRWKGKCAGDLRHAIYNRRAQKGRGHSAHQRDPSWGCEGCVRGA
jgi:hypothetical protein